MNWDLAQKVATRIANRVALPLNYDLPEMEEMFARLTPKAETLVNKTTGLINVSNSSAARSKVLSRAEWIQANLKSFSRMLRPLEKHLEEKSNISPNSVSQTFGAIQVGILLGWMSTRVLGQYDLLIIEDEEPESQDMVYFVGPNIAAIEWKYGFNPEDFRLWIALHELTHRAQFVGVPWLRGHFLSLLDQSLENINFDGEQIKNMLNNIKAQRSQRNGNFSENFSDNLNLASLFSNQEQLELLETLGGFMSLLEGHGEVMMDKAAHNQIADLGRFHRIIRHRRNNAKGLSSIFQKLLGMESKLRQYEAGENFVKKLQAEGGDELLNQAFKQAENLPSMNEINNPSQWIERIDHAGLKS